MVCVLVLTITNSHRGDIHEVFIQLHHIVVRGDNIPAIQSCISSKQTRYFSRWSQVKSNPGTIPCRTVHSPESHVVNPPIHNSFLSSLNVIHAYICITITTHAEFQFRVAVVNTETSCQSCCSHDSSQVHVDRLQAVPPNTTSLDVPWCCLS